MPTLSFKDRGAAVLMAHCKAIGVDSVVLYPYLRGNPRIILYVNYV